MENPLETLVVSDDGQATRTTVNRRQSPKRQNIWKSSFLRLGVGCIMIAFISTMVVVAIVKLVPSNRKSISKAEKRQDKHEIVLKGTFSTSYIPENKSQSLLNIKNVDDITNQLNRQLNGNKVGVINAVLRNSFVSNGSEQTQCENPLSGYVLQLSLVTFYSRACVAEKENLCKTQLQEKLKNMFKQMSTIPITIQFDDDRFESITIQICNLNEIKEKQEDEEEGDKTLTRGIRRRKFRKTTPPMEMGTEIARNILFNVATPSVVLKKSECSLSLGKIVVIQMTGEYGSRIQDDTRTNLILNDDRNREDVTVTLFEDATYRLHVQLDCGRQYGRNSYENVCDTSQNINVWIDYNDNGFDDAESRIFHRSSSNSYIHGNTYDLEISIPITDGRNIRSGSHAMRVTVIPNEEYQRDCGTGDYQETRDYTVNIATKARYPAVVDTLPSNPVYRNPLCSLNTGKIVVVIMAGERGTQIRDDILPNTLVNDYQDRHHIAVTIYENTVYLIRIQLDCSWQLNRDLFEKGCNLAQDVNVWVDLNDDGIFDDSESGAPYHWPVTSYLPEGIYDLQIHIPLIDGRYTRNGPHRMRIGVMQSENYRRICRQNDHNETREYTINIIPRTKYPSRFDVTTPYPVSVNYVCSNHVGKIVLVLMAGEHRTQIRDDSSTRSLVNGDNSNLQHLNIILYQATVYLLRIQLDCSQQWTRDPSDNRCNLGYDVNVWIDLNDDGIFDDSENASPFRWPLNSYTPQGVYDLQIYVPAIDESQMKIGPHRMRLAIVFNEQYQRKCGSNDFRETREYTVTIVPTTRHAVDMRIPYLALSNTVCSKHNARIVLVIMAGEQGTHIRDNLLTNNSLTENQNRHHLSVTLYENTDYRLRIQLDCRQYSSRGLYSADCNLAQDVNVLIDLNNDGQYDETESRVPHRWPLYSSMPLGIYDLNIHIPPINRLNRRTDTHRMRILVTTSEEYRRKCGTNDYSETREYTVNVIPAVVQRGVEYDYTPDPRSYSLPESRSSHCSPGSLICSDGNNGISLVKLFGEQSTQIHDDIKECSLTNNYFDRSNLVVSLFDETVYTLRMELYCTQQQQQQWNSNNQDPLLFQRKCNYNYNIDVWIDFNNDGIFNENQEKVLSNDWDNNDYRTADYNLNLNIPKIDNRNYFNGQHRMRILLTQDQTDRTPCYNNGYGEARDYTVQIIPKPFY